MNNLLRLQPITTLREVDALRDLYNKVETQIRSLENLGIDSTKYGPLLIPVLLSKIPDELNLIISRQFTNNDCWDIVPVLNALKTELVAREKTSFSVEQHSDIEFTAASLYTSVNTKSSRNKNVTITTTPSCIFCNKDHKPHHCKTVTNIDARKIILKNKERCFVCLKNAHIAKQCKSQIKCYKCSGRHHLAVCYHNGGDPPNNKETSCQHVGSTSSNYSLLLQTAHVNIRNRNITSFARILFDNGSQLSYITPELRNRLQLETIDTREICIKTFGSVTTKETLDRVNVKLTSIKGKDIYFRCYVKEICQPLTAQNTKFAIEHYQHLRKLKLADYHYDVKPRV